MIKTTIYFLAWMIAISCFIGIFIGEYSWIILITLIVSIIIILIPAFQEIQEIFYPRNEVGLKGDKK